ncbi:phytase [Croceicoccus sp. Ery15]|uniref:phytase n=1 Tax=Croceicoccus sp. Ery15 TaxID=1703338 RepID=UPI001E3EF938|nr:phytase [Croceicoccus sp. Ery15]
MKNAIKVGAVIAPAILLAACASEKVWPPSPWPTGSVEAAVETVPVGTANADAADDPAIWRNPVDSSKSILLGTDKKAGLYSYAMDGTVIDFVPAGLLNNVDLVSLADGTVLVAASDRTDGVKPAIAFFTLATDGKLTKGARLSVGTGEAYGFCMAHTNEEGQLARAYIVTKEGPVIEAVIGGTVAAPTVLSSRVFDIPSQSEGCVVDGRTNMLYVGEEAAGIHRFDLSQDAPAGKLVAVADGTALVPDVEGLAIAPMGEDAGYLIASSQGDNAYTAFALPSMAYVGRVRIADGAQIDGTSETDGIEFAAGDFGPAFPDGIFIAQDGDNGADADGNATQNFKLVRGDALIAALRGE